MLMITVIVILLRVLGFGFGESFVDFVFWFFEMADKLDNMRGTRGD